MIECGTHQINLGNNRFSRTAIHFSKHFHLLSRIFLILLLKCSIFSAQVPAFGKCPEVDVAVANNFDLEKASLNRIMCLVYSDELKFFGYLFSI